MPATKTSHSTPNKTHKRHLFKKKSAKGVREVEEVEVREGVRDEIFPVENSTTMQPTDIPLSTTTGFYDKCCCIRIKILMIYQIYMP